MTETVRMPAPAWNLDMTIDGRSVAGQGPLFEVENPATEEALVKVPEASLAQVDAAVVAARRAFESGVWRDPEFRRETMLRLADLMEEHADELTSAIVHEVGTPIALSESMHIGEPIRYLRWNAEEAVKDRTRHLGRREGPPPTDAIIRYHAAGVAALISAYNYPLLIAALKLAPAMAAGCTSVLLPSFQTPLSSLLFGALLEDAGVPPGVVNVIVGGPQVGQALTTHEAVDVVSFT